MVAYLLTAEKVLHLKPLANDAAKLTPAKSRPMQSSACNVLHAQCCTVFVTSDGVKLSFLEAVCDLQAVGDLLGSTLISARFVDSSGEVVPSRSPHRVSVLAVLFFS